MLFQRPNYDWLIAGLGNPGAEYEKTRHNTGFMTLDLLAARLQVKVSKERFKGAVLLEKSMNTDEYFDAYDAWLEARAAQ